MNTPVQDGVEESEFEENTFRQQTEGLWKTDVGDTIVNTRPGPSVEDKRTLEMMEDPIQKVNGHYQVSLSWKSYPPDLPNNRSLAVRR